MSSQLAEFEKRAREAILNKTVEDYRRQHGHWQNEEALIMTVMVACLCSWQNAALLGGTMLFSGLLLALIRPMPLVALLVIIFLGSVVELVFLFVSSADKQRLAAAVAQLHAPRDVFALETIRTKHLRARLGKALQYWGLIDTMQRNQPDGLLHDRMVGAGQEMTRWLQGVYHLAGWVDKYSYNALIQRELQILPQVIQSYEQKLSREHKPELHAQLQQTLTSKQHQLQTLGELQNNIEKAAHQLDSTIASMGVVYSQLLLLVSTRNVESGRMNRLQTEIAEEVQRLEDLTTAMDEFYRIDQKLNLTGTSNKSRTIE